jgi:hypothetical protein
VASIAVAIVPYCRQDNDRDLRVIGADSLDQIQTADLRNLQVRNHDVDRLLVQDIERLFGGRRHMDVKTCLRCHVLAEIPRRDFIVHDQQVQNRTACPRELVFRICLHGRLFSKQEQQKCQIRRNH